MHCIHFNELHRDCLRRVPVEDDGFSHHRLGVVFHDGGIVHRLDEHWHIDQAAVGRTGHAVRGAVHHGGGDEVPAVEVGGWDVLERCAVDVGNGAVVPELCAPNDRGHPQQGQACGSGDGPILHGQHKLHEARAAVHVAEGRVHFGDHQPERMRCVLGGGDVDGEHEERWVVDANDVDAEQHSGCEGGAVGRRRIGELWHEPVQRTVAQVVSDTRHVVRTVVRGLIALGQVNNRRQHLVKVSHRAPHALSSGAC
mmetsp:Transcript_95109/g.164149  ORF Transcript_95109/g.164149 Transcript_95109/m.164149 type:complete len:254 (+) Transcript_95109:931-1692(+)